MSDTTERYFLSTFFCKRGTDGCVYGKLDGRRICSSEWFSRVFKTYDDGGLIELYGYDALLSAFLCLLKDGDESAFSRYGLSSKE